MWHFEFCTFDYKFAVSNLQNLLLESLCNEKKFKKKRVGKKFSKKNVGKKSLKKKMYNSINKCDSIFALLAPLDRDREKRLYRE